MNDKSDPTPARPSEILKSERSMLELYGTIPRTALRALRLAVKSFLGNVKPSPLPGREERMFSLVHQTITRSPLLDLLPGSQEFILRLDVNEAFGKPLLVSFDVLLPVTQEQRFTYSPQERLSLRSLIIDHMERIVTAVWDNPEIAPVAVRGRILLAQEKGAGSSQILSVRNRLGVPAGERLVVDMRDLGYPDEIARVEDLFERLGPPASDPDFRP